MSMLRAVNRISGEEAGFWGLKLWQTLLIMLHQEPPPGPWIRKF